jgi:hypothetical protein
VCHLTVLILSRKLPGKQTLVIGSFIYIEVQQNVLDVTTVSSHDQVEGPD